MIAGDSRGDQKRVMTPKQAFKDGATSLVIGRSLTSGNLKKHQKLIQELAKMKVKICGLNPLRDVQLCINLKVDFRDLYFTINPQET